MREKDIHNLIEQQEPEAKQRVWERIASQVDLTSAPKQTAPSKKTWKWATLIASLIVVVTLSIVLPLALRDDGPTSRYCDITQYTVDNLGQTLKQYADEHNSSFMYVDWYDNAAEITTEYGYNKEDKNDIFFFTETFVNENNEMLTLSITDSNTRVGIFESYYSKYEEVSVNNIKVMFRCQGVEVSYATFEYENYNYYLQIDVGDGQERLTEIIKEMLK